MEALQAESEDHSKVISPSKEASDGQNPVTTELIISAKGERESPQSHGKSATWHVSRHGVSFRVKKHHTASCTESRVFNMFHLFYLKAGVRSRLPVPVRLRVEASSSSSRQSVSSDHLNADALQNPSSDDVHGSDQQLHTDSDSPLSPQHSTSPSSTLRHAHRSRSPVGSDKDSEDRTLDHTQADSALYTQLELLHQECQEKEGLINKLSEQLADWEELHAQLQEKDRLNRQYVEALQAAESTIAYLTACSLDSQGGFGSHTSLSAVPGSGGSDTVLHSRCLELQKALQEKEELNHQLIELLSVAGKAITSSDSEAKNPQTSDLCSKIETALQQQQVNASSDSQSPRDGSAEDAMQELQRHADSLQEALWEQNRINAELQEKLRAIDAAAAEHNHNSNSADQNGELSRETSAESLKEKESKERQSSEDVSLNQEMSKVLLNCLSAAESAVASLAEHCTNTSSFAPGRSSQTNSDLQMNLDKLQRALQERKDLEEPTEHADKSGRNQSAATKGQLRQELHNNLCRLYKAFSDHCRRISELQASVHDDRGRREESKDHRTMQDVKGLPPSVQVQLETLHKALREKKKACKSLEEQLATALTNTSPETARKGKTLSCCVHDL